MAYIFFARKNNTSYNEEERLLRKNSGYIREWFRDGSSPSKYSASMIKRKVVVMPEQNPDSQGFDSPLFFISQFFHVL
nr:MAG TPA: hypothetical protein [Caudoviricetes sp.]